MHSFLWVLSPVIIVSLSLFVVPLGFTHKGKAIIVIISSIFGIGGLAVSSIFSVWQIVVLILALASLFGYIIDNRLRNVIYLSSLESIKDLITEDFKPKYEVGNEEGGILGDLELAEVPILFYDKEVKQEATEKFKELSLDETSELTQDWLPEFNDMDEIIPLDLKEDKKRDITLLYNNESLLKEEMSETKDGHVKEEKITFNFPNKDMLSDFQAEQTNLFSDDLLSYSNLSKSVTKVDKQSDLEDKYQSERDSLVKL